MLVIFYTVLGPTLEKGDSVIFFPGAQRRKPNSERWAQELYLISRPRSPHSNMCFLLCQGLPQPLSGLHQGCPPLWKEDHINRWSKCNLRNLGRLDRKAECQNKDLNSGLLYQLQLWLLTSNRESGKQDLEKFEAGFSSPTKKSRCSWLLAVVQGQVNQPRPRFILLCHLQYMWHLVFKFVAFWSWNSC